MLKKLNITLGILVLIGALLCGGFYIYCHSNSIADSSVIQTLEG